MKTRRQFLYAAWLAACALLLLSACRGPTPIAGRVTEITATGGASNTPLPAYTPTASHTPTAESTAPPTRPATDTATPTDTNTQTTAPTPPESSATATQEPDETPVPSPTPEITAPVIAGLSLKPDGKGGMLYVTEKDNPYGVAVGEVVGRVSSVQVLGEPRWDGQQKKTIREFAPAQAIVITEPKVLAKLTEQANTPEEIKKGNWKIALPFEPGPETRVWEGSTLLGTTAININGLPKDGVIVNPYHIPIKVKSYARGAGASTSRIQFFVPNELALYEDINWGPGLTFYEADALMVGNAGKQVAPGGVILKGIRGELLPVSTYGKNVQAKLSIASLDLSRAGDFSFHHVLRANGAFVFAGSN